ncbi:DNA primase [Orenia marismortui]|uniref:DNA primase n=1 Tax=Orenia marismortui TaxID=46469 RepID=UPI00037B36B8|nr:DNA primase [Orenia marismortui]
MSYSYSEEFIDQVRFNNDMVDIVSDYTNLEKSGKSYKGLCPFHDENTPSFNVNSDQQLYYCFGCGAGGDIFKFIMDIEGVNFVEAVKVLADKANIPLPNQSQSPQMKQKMDEKKKLLQIHQLSARFYNYLLTSSDLGKEAKAYLNNRGFDNEIIEKFNLGFAPNRWQGLYNFLKNKGYSDQILAKSGLIIPRKNSSGYYDRFRNRVIFTIYNHRGQVIGFGGRIIEEVNQPKYLNSPDTIIFDKSKNLYGLNVAKRHIQNTNEAIIVEGYTDVITANQFNIKNTVASLGTALTSNQAKLLKRYANTVYIAYDSDTAGAKATLRGLDILKEEGLIVKVITLPQDQDPDQFIKEEQRDGFISLQQKAQSLIEFKINSILDNQDFSNVDNKVKAVKGVIPVLLEINNEIELAEYCKMVSSRLNIELSVLKNEIKKYRFKKQGQDRKLNYRNNINNKKMSNLKEKLNDSELILHLKAINELLRHVIRNPEIINKLKGSLRPKDFIQKEYKELVKLIYDFYDKNNELDINSLLNKIDDKETKDLLLKLSVKDDDMLSYTEDMVCDDNYIKRIKEYQVAMRKQHLETEIRKAESNGEDDRVTKLQMEYLELLRKEVN